MGNEILAVKMNELEQKINELYSRIRRCEHAGRGEIRAVLEAQRRECAETERNLQNRMRFSKSEMVQALSGVYDRVEELLGGLRKSIYDPNAVGIGEEFPAAAAGAAGRDYDSVAEEENCGRFDAAPGTDRTDPWERPGGSAGAQIKKEQPLAASSPEQYAEEKILVAEYALDFAMQACEQALLAALEAIDAGMTLDEKEPKEGSIQ